MELNGKKRVALIAVAVIVVVAVILVFIMVGKKGSAPAANDNNINAENATASSGTATRLPAPANVIVPDAGAQNVSADVAVPQVVSAAAPGADSKYRSFNIIVQNGEFMPSTIAVNLGDTVDLQIGAVGGNYDFTQPDYGLRVSLQNGQNKKVEFAAMSSGKFVFYCSSCGGPAKGPMGYLVVAGK